MFHAIVFLPLFGALIAGLFGRVLGARPSELITTGFMMVAAILSWVAFVQVAIFENTQQIELWSWIVSGTMDVSWMIRVDTMTAVMLVVVNTVSSLVHLYSIGYMHDDPHRPRFFAYLSLFTFAMLMLVTADNFLQMFFGWEGVGLASYLLIGFWYKKPEANAAAIKAFVVNRVGDFGFILGVIGVFVLFGSLDFDQVFGAVTSNETVMGAPIQDLTVTWFGIEWHALTIVCLLLFMGAMGKSAQFLLHTWLPDAMEGPTPVSALIHAATMVTAGVFLVCRCSPLFEYAPDALMVVTIVGGITAFFAATIGLAQNDIKRVIAYSTCSQLGYMFFAAGLSAYQAAMFHLFTHAFFKALLFLGAGSVIHAMHHEQDMRKMGGLVSVTPWTWAMMLIGTIALTGVGIPGVFGLAGFYSKDAIIETAFATGDSLGAVVFLLGIVAALLTSIYSWRLMFMTFHGKHRMSEDVLKHAHESPSVMLAPLMALAVGAVFAGIAFYPMFVGKNETAFWGNSIYTVAGAQHAGHDSGDSHGGYSGDDSHSVAHGNEEHRSDDHMEPSAHASATNAEATLASGEAPANAGYAEAGEGITAATGGHDGSKIKGPQVTGTGVAYRDAFHDRHYVPTWVLWAPTFVSVLGFLIAYYFYIMRPELPGQIAAQRGPLLRFLQNKWYFDEIYNFIFVRPVFWIGRVLWKGGDGRIIDGLGPDGISARVLDGTRVLVRLQSGYLYHYAFVMLIGIALAVTYFIWRGA